MPGRGWWVGAEHPLPTVQALIASAKKPMLPLLLIHNFGHAELGWGQCFWLMGWIQFRLLVCFPPNHSCAILGHFLLAVLTGVEVKAKR